MGKKLRFSLKLNIGAAFSCSSLSPNRWKKACITNKKIVSAVDVYLLFPSTTASCASHANQTWFQTYYKIVFTYLTLPDSRACKSETWSRPEWNRRSRETEERGRLWRGELTKWDSLGKSQSENFWAVRTSRWWSLCVFEIHTALLTFPLKVFNFHRINSFRSKTFIKIVWHFSLSCESILAKYCWLTVLVEVFIH